MRINIGCGNRKMPGWINIDSQPQVNPDKVHNIEDGLPYTDNTVEVVNARAILEHVKADKLIFVMREIYRVLKPGGLLYVMVPHWNQRWMWSDPTHCTAWSREMMDWFIGKSKPSDIGIDFAFEELSYSVILHPDAQLIADKLKLTLGEARKYLADIIDAHTWWLKKPGAGLNHTITNNEIRSMNIYPNGYENILLPQESKPVITQRSSLPPPLSLPTHTQRNKLLWFINVPWIGGTALWALEAIESMGSYWHHTVCYMGGGENEWIAERFKTLGCDFSMAGYGITKELVESVNPTAIIISNVNPRKIEGWKEYVDTKGATLWLTQNYYTAYVHHSEVTPWLPNANVDVFVSEWLMTAYKNLYDKMKMRMIVPSGIYVRPHLSNKIKKRSAKKVIVGRLTNDNVNKFPPEFFNILKKYGGKCEIVGGAKYYKETAKITFLDFYTMKPHQYMARWDIFVYKTNVEETWGRTIAEAMASGLPVVAEDKGAIFELVVDGETGFLCKTDDEIVERLKELQSDKELRVKMGKAGRKRIKKICMDNPFTKHVEPLLIGNALRS